LLGEHGINRPMQISVVERQVCPDELFEGKPAVLNGVQIRGIGRQEFLGAASALNELAGFGRLVETGIVVDHNLSRFQNRHQTVLDIGFEECLIAGPLEHERGDQLRLVKGINQTHAVSAMAGLLPPARFALGAPALGAGFIISHPGLIQIHQLLGGHARQLRAKLLPQRFVPLGITKGLFLCV
jgi:hypothetical protein